SDRRQYERSFQILGERSKKRVSDRYFLQLLDAELNEMVTRRRHVGSRVRYMSARAEDDPFLLADRVLPDAQGNHVTGLLAPHIDLGQLQHQLLPAHHVVAVADLGIAVDHLVWSLRVRAEGAARRFSVESADHLRVECDPRAPNTAVVHQDVCGAAGNADARESQPIESELEKEHGAIH